MTTVVASWINTAEIENHCPLTVFVSVCSLELNGTMHFTSNDEVQLRNNQRTLTEIIQARRLTLFGYIARLDDSV